MKEIYLTEEGKKEIEAKIALYESCGLLIHQIGELTIYKEILSSATILPVEESWENVKDLLDINTFPISYKNGVIIKPKE
jgi:hypothetical protein